MKQQRLHVPSALVLLVIASLLAGCEAAQVPLGEADEMLVDPRVTGQWVSVSDDDDDDDSESRMSIWAFNDHEYYVEWETVDGEHDMDRIRMYASDLGDVLFANVQCIDCTPDERDEWFFFQFELVSDNELILRSIENEHYRDAMADMTRSRDVRQYVEQHMHDDSFFSEEVGRFVRANPSDEG